MSQILDYLLVRFCCGFLKYDIIFPGIFLLPAFIFFIQIISLFYLISYSERRLFVSWPFLSLKGTKLDPTSNVRYSKLAILCEKGNLIFGICLFVGFFLLCYPS